MTMEQKLLLIIDPTADSQPAVDRLCDRIINQPTYKPEIAVLFTTDANAAMQMDNKETGFCDLSTLEALVQPLKDAGVDPEISYSWNTDWAETILGCASAKESTSIMVSHPGRNANRAISDDFWYLIRHSTIPVGILQETPPTKENKKILVSMDLQDNKLQGLNKRLFETSQRLSEIFNAEIHLANAYRSSAQYPDRGKIVALTGLANENIHLRAGEPDEALAEITAEISPNLIIFGATRRTGLRAALRGRKIGQILKTINRDLLVVA